MVGYDGWAANLARVAARAQRHDERLKMERPELDQLNRHLQACQAARDEIAAEKLAELVAERAVWCCI